MTTTTYKWSIEKWHQLVNSELLEGKPVKLLEGEIIEISNRTLIKDLSQKIITYARNGIPEYWVIDLVNKKLITHTQIQNNNYFQVTEYTKGTVSSSAFPDIAIALDKLLLF